MKSIHEMTKDEVWDSIEREVPAIRRFMSERVVAGVPLNSVIVAFMAVISGFETLDVAALHELLDAFVNAAKDDAPTRYDA